ncbi:MAG TPA: L-aspartate oxidase [Planctomycetota bacterium]
MKQRFALDHPSRLLSVDSRRVPIHRFGVVVVGSGVAGATAALAAADAGIEVALLTKAGLEESNTVYAQGGVAAVLGPGDSPEAHAADTLAVGCGLSERSVVESVVRAGPAAIAALERRGTHWDRRADGALELSREGGHSSARVVHARGDATGREVQDTLSAAVQAHARITVFPHTFVVDLLCAHEGRVVGALVRTARGDLAVFSGGAVILATGGAGQLYRETTNPAIATGDGVAIGFRAGAAVRDLEFFQFHPTLLYIAGAARVLISEVVRGAGGVLRDRRGVRFMEQVPGAELAPRDVVSRAIFERMVATQDTSVYLDLKGVAGDPHALFPGISRICRYFGIDIARDPVPVRPGAHYMIGGLETDLEGRTTLPGLWAVGECASSGLHGANRMGSNSLLEGLVLGERAGRAAAEEAQGKGIQDWHVRPPRAAVSAPDGMRVNIQDVTYSLKSLMWRQMGIERRRAEIEDALAKIRLWSRAVSELGTAEPATWELLNLLTVAHLAALGALVRAESRGVHYRTDHSAPEPLWRAHTRIEPVFEEDQLPEVVLTRVPLESGLAVAGA